MARFMDAGGSTGEWEPLEFGLIPNPTTRTLKMPRQRGNRVLATKRAWNLRRNANKGESETEEIPALLADVAHRGVGWFLWVIPYPTVEITFEMEAVCEMCCGTYISKSCCALWDCFLVLLRDWGQR